ncbi:MAG: PfkB family carbohydrate kinase, partial [Haloferacaceae archaeon]
DDPLASLLDADLVCSANWSAFHGSTEVFEAVADAGEGVFVFDPGSLGGLPDGQVRRLLDGLGHLEPAYRTVLAGNGVEIDALAAAAGVDSPDHETAVAGVRDAAGISGVVAHEEEVAVAGTGDGTVVVPNLDTDRVATVTGAGDRFTAGLGHGLAAGWGWEVSLALGNTCASYHVVHGETIERDDVADYVQRHEARF